MTIDYRILKILDDCGDTSTITDWEEGNDALNPVDETTLIKQGSHSMALEIDADKSVEDKGHWLNLQSQGDLSAYQNDWMYLWVYFSTLDYMLAAGAAFQYRIGSGGADVLKWDWTKVELSVGWNLLKCDFDNSDGTTGTVDWAAIDYQLIQVHTVAGNTNDFTIYVDSIMFVRPFLKGFSLLPIFRTRRR